MSVKLPETERPLWKYCQRMWRRNRSRGRGRNRSRSESTREMTLDRRGTAASGDHGGYGDSLPWSARVIKFERRRRRNPVGSFRVKKYVPGKEKKELHMASLLHVSVNCSGRHVIKEINILR